jgi:hypothetical protein
MKPISIILLLLSFPIYSQQITLDSATVDSNIKAIKYDLVKRKILKNFTCERPNVIKGNLIDEKFALAYALEAYKKIYSFEDLEKQEYGIAVREDDSKKFWIVMILFPNALDGVFGFIISKNDGQLIYFENHWKGY